MKKNINLPLITNYKKNISILLDLEQRANSIYYLPIDQNQILNEYKQKPIIKTNTKNK